MKRKFGNHDFERSDNLPSRQASVGFGEIGKVQVDCRLKCGRSQWGVIGNNPTPAGIIYLDLNFHQPADSRLKCATVTVSLDDIPQNNERYPRNDGVQFYEWYGPQQLFGQPRHMTSTEEISMLPSLDAGGIAGFGGVGKRFEKSLTQESRWIFSGRLLPGKTSPLPKIIQWNLVENYLEAHPLHSNVIHTAFSFHHNQRPFTLRIEVSGRLRGKTGRVKHALQKFSSRFSRGGGHATTLVDFRGRGIIRKPLDKLAEGLPFAMEKENYEEAPVVVPGPREVVFEDGSGGETEETAEERHHTTGEIGKMTSIRTRRRNYQGTDQADPTTPALISAESAGQETIGDICRDPTEPIVENIARVYSDLVALKRPFDAISPGLNERANQTTEGTIHDLATVLEQEAGTRNSRSEMVSQDKPLKGYEDTEAVLALLRSSGLLSVLQLFVSLLTLCGAKLQSKATTKDKENLDKEA